jgi:hypothetical protein
MSQETKRFASELDALLHGDRAANDHTAHLVDEVGSALNAKIRKMKALEAVMDECETVETRLVQRLRPVAPVRPHNPDPLGRDIGMPRVLTRHAQPTQHTPPPIPPAPDFSAQEYESVPRRAVGGF